MTYCLVCAIDSELWIANHLVLHVGITQRDMNFYDYMSDPVTQTKIKSTVRRLWEENIRPRWTFTQPDCTYSWLNDLTEKERMIG